MEARGEAAADAAGVLRVVKKPEPLPQSTDSTPEDGDDYDTGIQVGARSSTGRAADS